MADILTIGMPNTCKHCKFENLKIHGTRINGRVQAKVRCMRCGKILREWDYNIRK